MKLTIKVTAVSSTAIAASVTYDGCTAPISISFTPRSGSKTSHIASLPKSLVALGTATNVTIATNLLTLGAVIERESVKGAAHATSGPRGKRVSVNPLFYGLDEAGNFAIWEVAPDGTKITRLHSEDAALAYAFVVAKAFAEYTESAKAYALGALKAYNDNAPIAKTALKNIGYTDERIAALFAGGAPIAPTFVMPKMPKVTK